MSSVCHAGQSAKTGCKSYIFSSFELLSVTKHADHRFFWVNLSEFPPLAHPSDYLRRRAIFSNHNIILHLGKHLFAYSFSDTSYISPLLPIQVHGIFHLKVTQAVFVDAAIAATHVSEHRCGLLRNWRTSCARWKWDWNGLHQFGLWTRWVTIIHMD